MRNKYELTKDESAVLRALPPIPGVAFKLWREIAASRDLDYSTIIVDKDCIPNKEFTAIELAARQSRSDGRRLNWCYPHKRRCRNKPPPEPPEDKHTWQW